MKQVKRCGAVSLTDARGNYNKGKFSRKGEMLCRKLLFTLRLFSRMVYLQQQQFDPVCVV